MAADIIRSKGRRRGPVLAEEARPTAPVCGGGTGISGSFPFSVGVGVPQMFLVHLLLLLLLLLLWSSFPSATCQYLDDGPLDNVITQWNKLASVEYPFLHLAQLKVLKGIRDGESDVNPTAAVAYVSRFVLRSFCWEMASLFDFVLQQQVNPLQLTAREKIKAQKYAIKVGLPIVKFRISSVDNFDHAEKVPAPPNGPPGVYQFAPGQLFILTFNLGLKPFLARDTKDYVRALGGPPPVPSAEYNAALKEVRELGALNGSSRTTEQDAILQFHANGITEFNTIYRFWFMIARKVLPTNISLYETAYIFAEMSLSILDGGLVVGDAKSEYFFWRPITAIRQGDSQNKPVKDWTPSAPTFEDPEYPSGTAALVEAPRRAMANYFGTDNVTFSFTVPINNANVTRTYRSFSQFVKELGDWRIYCGNHYRFSVNAGYKTANMVSKIVSAKLKAQFK